MELETKRRKYQKEEEEVDQVEMVQANKVNQQEYEAVKREYIQNKTYNQYMGKKI